MPFQAAYAPYSLIFKEPATTSRATMTAKETFFVKIWHSGRPEEFGIGECAVFRGLGDDDTPDYDRRLADICRHINRTGHTPAISGIDSSSMRFGLETALADLAEGACRRPWPGPWPEGNAEIAINGLIWMGSRDEMLRRIDAKLKTGFRCMKLKIGGIRFDDELGLIRHIRSVFPASELELRLDANGAFTPDNAIERLQALASYSIHSIEQPLPRGLWEQSARVCAASPIPVALDEELIGITPDAGKRRLLSAIRPAYIILKPSLCGGFAEADRWIDAAGEYGIGWWATSALESNVGLNAIAQWVARKNPAMPQGLGTGALYTNNIPSPLCQVRDVLTCRPDSTWQIPEMPWITPR